MTACSSTPSTREASSYFGRLTDFLFNNKEKAGEKASKLGRSIFDEQKNAVFQDSRPYVRWWWLKGPYRKADIRIQLDWIQQQGFGGVEIAWLRPDWLADSEDPILPQGLSPKEKILTLGLPIQEVLYILKKKSQTCPLPKCGRPRCFEIYQEATRWACSECNERGDSIELVAKIKGKSRQSATKWLAKKSKISFDPQEMPEAKLEWLSEKFSDFMSFTKQEAQRRNLGCDFTFGTGWPFGGGFLTEEEQSQTFDSLSEQSIDGSWEGYRIPVLNHLSAKALDHYGQVVGKALAPALQGRASALFCDSLELQKDRLWDNRRLWEAFKIEFGYDLRDYLAVIDSDPHVRYDHRKMIGQAILQEFYQHFTGVCHQLGAYSRVQCHGAPTDLLAAYAAVDIPESESLLFHPWFSKIPASSAAIANRPVVSCETFTCLYGFPKKHWKKEQILDLKLLADALFANGVNQIIWHGMPYFQKGRTSEFYATTHVGPDSAFINELKGFNQYLTKISDYMKIGKPYFGLAVYLPNEDMMMMGELPEEQKVPAAKDHWEMREVKLPAETEGYMPVWISAYFLEKGIVVNGKLCVGEIKVPALYLDVEWLDAKALDQIIRLASEGLSIVLKKMPKQPGKIPSSDYASKLERLKTYPKVTNSLAAQPSHPLIEGENLPYFWIREDKGDFYIFFAHPETHNVRYPMEYHQSEKAIKTTREVRIHLNGHSIQTILNFEQNESLMMKISPEGESFLSTS